MTNPLGIWVQGIPAGQQSPAALRLARVYARPLSFLCMPFSCDHGNTPCRRPRPVHPKKLALALNLWSRGFIADSTGLLHTCLESIYRDLIKKRCTLASFMYPLIRFRKVSPSGGLVLVSRWSMINLPISLAQKAHVSWRRVFSPGAKLLRSCGSERSCHINLVLPEVQAKLEEPSEVDEVEDPMEYDACCKAQEPLCYVSAGDDFKLWRTATDWDKS